MRSSDGQRWSISTEKHGSPVAALRIASDKSEQRAIREIQLALLFPLMLAFVVEVCLRAAGID